MAELPYGGAGQSGPASLKLGTLTHYAGAVVSLGLIVGIGVWGYKVIVRDVSGVPVVRAASNAPMRIAPEQPGGETAAHQGLSVNEVMAKGGAEKPADRLVLAPKPVNLEDEDQPSAASITPKPVARSEAVMAQEEGEAEPLTLQMASIRALAEELADGVAPLTVSEAPEVVTEVVTAAAVVVPVAPVVIEAVPDVEAEVAGLVKTAVSQSLRPRLRPEALRAVASSATNEAVLAALTSEAGSIAVGTRLVQLGAFDSAEVAGREWERLETKFSEYMDGKERVIQRAESGGRVFYRLRAMGFADLSDSRRFCAALVAERADCIPVVSK